MYTMQSSITTTEGMEPSCISLLLSTAFLPVSFIHSFHKWFLCTTKPESTLDSKNTKVIKTR